jgi:hypothetical protein
MPKMNPIVEQAIAPYHIRVESMTFPGSVAVDLKAEDFEQFIEALNSKIYPEHPLPHLYIKPATIEALQGLATYLLTHPQLKIQNLHLDMNGVIIDEHYRSALATIIQQISASGVAELHLDCEPNPFDEDELNELAEFIDQNRVATKISLPDDAQFSAMQFSIDIITQHNRARQQQAITAVENAKRKQDEAKPLPKRTRTKVRRAALNIDVELEQQVQVETSVERATQAEMEEPKKASVELIYSLDDLKSRINNQQLKLKPGADLLSDYDITRGWHAWFGNVVTHYVGGVRYDFQQHEPAKGTQVRVDTNLEIAAISVQAAEQLVDHYPQFQYGLDIHHLPAGFCLVEHPGGRNRKVLHYDKALFEATLKAPLAPALLPHPETAPLDFERFEYYSAVLQNHAAFTRIRLEIGKLTAPIYQRNAFNTMLSYLPQLLHYNVEQLNSIFAICTEGLFDAKRLCFMLDHGNQARHSNNIGAIERVLGGSENRERFLALQEEYQPVDAHVLFCLLEQKPVLAAQIKVWAEQYDLNTHQLDALLDVYNRFGTHGLEKLLAMPNMHPTLLKFGKTYVPLISDPRVQNALDTIARFTEEQRQWWDVLYAQHSDAVGYDDLPSLVESFEAFSNEIAKLGLRFYLPIHFEGIKSLPTTLARILSILKYCKPEDHEEQWGCISELSLQPGDAIFAMTEGLGTDHECRVVVPEMQVRATEYEDALGYQPKKDLKAPRWYLDETKKLKQAMLDKEFYRYLAYQKYRRPIREYREFVTNNSKVSKWSRQIPVMLYRIIAESTTQASNYLGIQSLSQAELAQHWQAFLDEIDKVASKYTAFKLPVGVVFDLRGYRSITDRIIGHFIETYFNTFVSMPSLPQLTELAKIHFASIETAHSTLGFTQKNPFGIDPDTLPEKDKSSLRRFDVFEAASRLDAQVELAIKIIAKHNAEEAVFGNLKRFTPEDRAKKQFLIKYLIFCSSLLECSSAWDHLRSDVRTQQGVRDFAKQLVSVAVTFNLFDPDSIPSDHDVLQSCEKTVEDFKPFIKKYLLSGFFLSQPFFDNAIAGLSLLANIQIRDKKLTKDKLKQFITDIHNLHAPSTVMQLVIKQFGEFFPENFFQVVIRQELPVELKNLIRDSMISEENRELIASILKRFLADYDDSKLKALFLTLRQFIRELPAEDTNTFLRMLARMNAVYAGNPKPRADDLNQLLTTALEFNSHRELMCLLSDAEEAKTPDNLIAMANEYLLMAVPFVRSAERPHLSRSEVFALARRYMLATNSVRPDADTVNGLVGMTTKFVEFFPGLKNELCEFFPQLFKDCVTQYTNLGAAYNQFLFVYKLLSTLKDSNITFSLCYHFSQMKEGRKPENLLAILNHSQFTTLASDRRELILKMVSVLLNNNQPVNIGTIISILNRCGGKPPRKKSLLKAQSHAFEDNIFIVLSNAYEKAPFPDIDTVMNWVSNAKTPVDLKKFIAEFDIKPCEREYSETGVGVNGFYLSIAKKQAKQFDGFTFHKEDLEFLDAAIKSVRKLTTKELISRLQQQGAQSQPDAAILTAVSAELLYRAKGLPAVGQGATREWGRSFEINTTQYLSIYASLKSGKHVTAQIDTSEGKTRYMMILAAAQHAMGKTVDFCTADMTLARREFTDYASYFSLIGAKTALIHADAPAHHYKLGGINFSDNGNLQLFRNKARTECQEHLVLHPEKKRRALLQDEGDKPYFDMAETRFNYSSQADAMLKEVEWIYPLLVEFFDKRDANNHPIHHTLYESDIDACNASFLRFCDTHDDLTPEQRARIRTIPNSQLEAWQESAMIALDLEFNKDFTILPNVIVNTARGSKAASEAKILVDGHLNPHAKFSFGVHQCLHARLNRLRRLPHLIESDDLKRALSTCDQPFHVEEEKQIAYSTTSKDLFDDYREGTLIAVSGTTGSEREREEAMLLYPSESGEPMHHMQVPRHLSQKRVDQPVQLVADDTHLVDFLADDIRRSSELFQPELVFSANDSDSEKLQRDLSARLAGKHPLVRIHAKTKPRDEEDHIKNRAGNPGVTTLSTGKLARGTHIGLAAKAKLFGMKSANTELTTTRETVQRAGRAARFGDAGEFQQVLKIDALKKQLRKKSLNDGLYTATESYIARQQQILDQISQNKRLINYAVGDFRKMMTDNFYRDFFAKELPHCRPVLETIWKQFFYDTDRLWGMTRDKCMKSANDLPPDTDAINAKLGSFRNQVQIRWRDMINAIARVGGAYPKSLMAELPALSLSPEAVLLMKKTTKDSLVPLKTTVAERYHPAHDGRAVLYTRPFELLRATFTGKRKLFADFRAWLRGAGILFPNLRAWVKGHMSFSQFLFGGFGVEQTQVKKLASEKMKVRRLDSSTIVSKQLGRLNYSLHRYNEELFYHTRLTRVNYLKSLVVDRVKLLEVQSMSERQFTIRHTVTELYLQYATMEDASSFISKSLEEALIKMLQIPKEALTEAREKRDRVTYKMNRFFNAGRSALKSYHDKNSDPVHHVIYENLPADIKSLLSTMKEEAKILDKQDRLETAVFGAGSLQRKDFAHVSHVLREKLNPIRVK